MDFEVGDIVAFSTEAQTGKIIRRLQRRLFGVGGWTEINHVAVCIQVPDILREAHVPKSSIRSNRTVKGRRVVAVAKPLYTEEKLDPDGLKEFMVSQLEIIGQWYGLLQLVGIVFVYWLDVLGVRLKRNPIRAGRICVEDVVHWKYDLEKHCGVWDGMNEQLEDIDGVYPGQLFKILDESDLYFVKWYE